VALSIKIHNILTTRVGRLEKDKLLKLTSLNNKEFKKLQDLRELMIKVKRAMKVNSKRFTNRKDKEKNIINKITRVVNIKVVLSNISSSSINNHSTKHQITTPISTEITSNLLNISNKINTSNRVNRSISSINSNPSLTILLFNNHSNKHLNIKLMIY
jgi:hypothetical protein